MVACSSKRKAQCHGPECSWIVGRGCRRSNLLQHVAQAVTQAAVACYKKRKAQCHGPHCVWVVGRGCKKAQQAGTALQAAAAVSLPGTPARSPRRSPTPPPSPRRSPTPVQRRGSDRLYILDNAGQRVQNITSLDNIPKTRAIKLDTQWYDTRYLLPWIQGGHLTIPHSRRKFTAGEYRKITGRNPPARLGLVSTPRASRVSRISRFFGIR